MKFMVVKDAVVMVKEFNYKLYIKLILILTAVLVNISKMKTM